MNKRLIISLVCLIMLCSFVFVFCSCDTGTYVYDGVLGQGSIKLGSFKKATIATEIVGLKYSAQGKYTISKKKSDGTKDVVISFSVDGEDKNIYGYIDLDGNLILNDVYRFVK